MTNTANQKPLRVLGVDTAWPYISLPYSQLKEVKKLLDDKGIRYWVRDNIISIDGGPEMTAIHLGRGTDVNTVQAILDSVE